MSKHALGIDPVAGDAAASAQVDATVVAAPSASPATGPAPALRSHDELKALAESGAAELGWDAPARDVIAWVERNFDLPAVAVACSMADAVLPALVADQLPGVDVLFLETGYHFPETYATRDEVAANLRVNVVDVLPENTVEQQDRLLGKDLFARDAAQCCALRKVAPLRRTLAIRAAHLPVQPEWRPLEDHVVCQPRWPVSALRVRRLRAIRQGVRRAPRLAPGDACR